MANEFIARKGIISLDSIQVSGSISATGGITISGSISSASFATTSATASSADNFFVRQNLTASSALFTGSITAQTLVVQTVTSSIVYSSGSNIFGNLPSNVQQFTGSLRVTGSGNHWVIGGNVGIGTSAPAAKIHMSNGASCDTQLLLGPASISGDYAYINWKNNAGSQELKFYNDAGFMSFYTNASEKVRITSGGNVGIGTTSPAVPLHISSSSSEILRINPATSGYISWYRGATWAGYIDAESGGDMTFANATSTGNLKLLTNSNTRLYVSASGNIGIGTTSPIEKLHVNGNVYIASSIVYGATSYSDAAVDKGMSFSGTNLQLNNSGERMRITSGGDVGIGTTSPQNYAGYTSLTIGDNDVNKRGLLKFKSCFNSGAGAEIFQSTAGVLSFSTTGASIEMAINCSGAVGIGCGTPSYRLDILDTCATGVRGLRINTASTSVGPSIILRYCTGGITNWLIGTSQAVSHTLEFVASCALGGDPGASGATRLLITCGGEVGIKTTSTSTEANLFLGAQGTVEGGQLVLQRGTSCNCATHLDNYQNTFRIMSGTDVGSTTVNMVVDHRTRNACFFGDLIAPQIYSSTSLISIPNSATTIFTSTGFGGVWLVTYSVSGNPTQVGYAIVGNAFGTTLTVLASAAGSQTALSVSGLNLQLSQSAGGSINTTINVIKLATTFG